MSKNNIKDLKELSFLKKEIRKEQMNKSDYQKYWVENKFKFRKMISQKNKAWFHKNSDSEFTLLEEKNEDIYLKICTMFSDIKKRKWLIHTISNFIPLSEAKQVVRLPEGNNKCCISNVCLTDLDSIKTGKNNAREKHIAYTGKKTDVVLSGLALNELVRFVCEFINDFDSPFGHIINHALDNVRNNKI